MIFEAPDRGETRGLFPMQCTCYPGLVNGRPAVTLSFEDGVDWILLVPMLDELILILQTGRNNAIKQAELYGGDPPYDQDAEG